MKVYMPELAQLEKLDAKLKAAKTPQQYAKVKAEIEFVYHKLRMELEENDD